VIDRPTPSVSAAEFDVLARRAGLTLTEAQRATLFEVYGSFEAMLARLRGTGERMRGAEPAHIFVPGQG
jgi:hypothetical protein